MSDFRLHQVDDPMRDTFNDGGHHAEPQQFVGRQASQPENQSYPRKKARNELITSGKGYLEICETMENGIISENCGVFSTFMGGYAEMAEYPVMDKIDHMLPTSFSGYENPDLLGNDMDGGNCNIPYDWCLDPPINRNLQDFGRIFRNNDSTTSGQERYQQEDALSWLLCSSHVNGDVFQENLNLGPQSSVVTSSASISKEMKISDLIDNNESTFGNDDCDSLVYSSLAKCLDSDAAGWVDSVYESVNVEEQYSKSQDQSNIENHKGQCDFQENAQQQNIEESLRSSTLTSEVSWCELSRECFSGVDLSSSLHPYVPHTEVKHDNFQQQAPTARSKSIVKTENENKILDSGKGSSQNLSHGFSHRENVIAVSSKHPPLASEQKVGETGFGQCLQLNMTSDHVNKTFENQMLATRCLPNLGFCNLKSQTRNDSQLQKTNEVCSLHDIHNSVMEAGPIVYLLPENVSLEPINFQQLQSVMNKWDERTKLCLRDGLYRLAKCAEQRNNVDNNVYECTENMEASKFVGTFEPSRHTAFTHVETATNAMDRSIMNLLFCKDSRLMNHECAQSHIMKA